MANELVARWGAQDLQKSTSLGYEAGLNLSQVGNVRGAAFPKNKNIVFTDVLRIPGNATLTTGIKFDFVAVDDGTSQSDLGGVAVLGVTVKKIADNTDTLDITASAGTEVTGNATIAATLGVARIVTVSVANANLDSAVAGDTIEVQLRRVGDNASDTLQNRLLVVAVTAYAY